MRAPLSSLIPKAPPPAAIMWELRISACELWGSRDLPAVTLSHMAGKAERLLPGPQVLAWNPGPDLPTPRPLPPFHGESRGLKRRPCSCAPSTASNPESSEPPSPAPSCVLGMSNGASAKDHLKGNRADTSSERSQHSVCAVTRTRHWHVLRGENATKNDV